MARRSSRSLAVRLTLVGIVVSCTSAGVEATSIPSSTSSSTTSTSTTTSTVTTTTTTVATTTSTLELADIDAEVSTPDGQGPFPSVVLVHGGGWVVGSPALMRPLARYLSDAGYLTVNTAYHLSTVDDPGFPQAIEDVACAVRYAAAHPDSDGTVVVVGHSAGAHLGAVVSLTGDDYTGMCPIDGDGLPDGFVGLAGPYDIRRLGLAMLVFFGEGPAADPEPWRDANPQLLTDENPTLKALIMYGDRDGLVDETYAIDFHTALLDSGVDSTIEAVEGARHPDLQDPRQVGDLIVTWLER